MKEAQIEASLRNIRHIALDLDGTVYSGGTLFPFTLPFLEELAPLGIGHTFLTNNSSKSAADYLEHFRRLGIPTTPEQIYTSSQATVSWLQRSRPELRRLFLLGTASLASEIAAAGFTLTRDDPADEPDAVLVGFDTSLAFDRLCRAAYWLSRGKPFIATHPDMVCPTDAPTVLVDCGSICAALEKATGRRPDAVPGKPDPAMLTGILGRHGLAPEELAMAGDRLYTDMAMAERAGAFGVLVLSGETTPDMAEQAKVSIGLIVQNLGELGERLRRSRRV